MLITSTKLAPPKPVTSTNDQEAAGVVLAVPEMTFDRHDDGGFIGTIAQGMYVFRADRNADNPFASQITGIAKTLSVNIASELNPYFGAGMRAGWVVAGAFSLLNRAQKQKLAWHEVALEGGLLTAESFMAASSALPENFQLNTDWSEGATCLIEVTQHFTEDGDANQFVMGQILNQSPQVGHLRTLLSLALAAQHPNSEFSCLSANAIDVKVEPLSQTLPRFLATEANRKRKSA